MGNGCDAFLKTQIFPYQSKGFIMLESFSV